MLPVKRDPIYGCDEYQGKLDSDGYGRVGRQLAHRVAWLEAKGPIPEGMEVEHSCRNRRCCNVKHLELASRSKNLLMRNWKVRARIKVLPCGHRWETHGRLTRFGGKVCRECR